MKGLTKRGEIWWLRKTINGKRYELSTEHTDRKMAQKRASQLVTAILAGEQGITKTSPTFKAWWVTYEETYTTRKATETQRRDRSIIKPWLVLWGEKRIGDIKQVDCLQALQARRDTGLVEGSVQRERRLIQAMFERALENDHIKKNPWVGVKSAPDVVRIRLLTDEAEAKLRATLQDPRGNMGNVKRAKPHVYCRFLTFVLETGARLNEALNIDPKEDIHGEYVSLYGKGSKWRDVPLTKKAKAALDEQLKEEGKLWTQHPQRVREVMATACQRAGIDHVSPHDLRHTFGWRYLKRGGRIHNLSKILGHASITVTERHYAHLLKEDIASEMLAVME